ncbi:hypothetical protein FG87_21940 [Nocardia vulneris]|uniref:Uncharacterized protein n=1 Tax=Nocardia vulneris TaxID=1141657 RepID=A0ABR4ZCQ5_9NOCA|nr:hypothetical protein FG87_21940 [Nocardia vulneris]
MDAAGGNAGIVDRLAAALKREGDRRTSHGFRLADHYVPIAERLLADTELLDALVAYRRPALKAGNLEELLAFPDGTVFRDRMGWAGFLATHESGLRGACLTNMQGVRDIEYLAWPAEVLAIPAEKADTE